MTDTTPTPARLRILILDDDETRHRLFREWIVEGRGGFDDFCVDARTVATTDCDIANEVVVFAYGPEIPNDGIAVAGGLPDDLKQQIADALMAYAETEEGAETLEAIYQITAFTEPNLEALDLVRQAVDELGFGG